MKTTINIKTNIEAEENVSIVQPRLRPEVEARLEEIEKDFEMGRNISPAFTNVEDLFKHLNSLK